MGIGTALLAAGGALKIGANIWGGLEAVKQSEYQQDILNYQAKYLDASKKIEEERLRRHIRKIISAQRATTAASGFQPDTGTPLELQIATELEGDIDIALLRQAGDIEQLRLQTEGRIAKAEGYGIARGLYTRAAATGIDTLLSMGMRHGWFNPRVKKVSVPKLTSRQQRLGV